MQKALAYLSLILVAAALRFIYLGYIPVALSHDEVDMIIQAHSVRITGSDLSGTWQPWSLLPNDAVMGELAPLVNVPLLSQFSNNLMSAHATSALLGSIYPALVVILLLQLGWGSRVAWISGILLALSPWHVLFSRTSLEQPTSLFFYTLAWIMLGRIFTKNDSIAKRSVATFSFILTYVIGFYTYHGFKFALPILTAIIAAYYAIVTKKFLPLIMVGLVIGGLYLRMFNNLDIYNSRGSEIIFLDSERFSKRVDYDRRISLLPSPITSRLTNKLTAMSSLAVDKYLYTMSPALIFARGESNGVFGTGRTGYLYLILIPFVMIGVSHLLRLREPRHRLLLVLVLISPLATVIHVNNAIAFRSAIYFVFLTIIAAVGMVRASSSFSRINLIRLTMLGVIVSTLHFGYVYLAYYPVESARAYFQADRVLASYLSRRSEGNILVIDPQPRYIMSYLALTQSNVNYEVLAPLLSNYNPDEAKNIYQLDNLTIRRDCPKEIGGYDSIIIDSTLMAGIEGICPVLDELTRSQKYTITQITDPIDSGDKKIIYNDLICDEYQLASYINPKSLKLFALDDLSSVQFCTNWITKH